MVIRRPPLKSPAQQSETWVLPRAMPTNATISLTVTPPPRRSPNAWSYQIHVDGLPLPCARKGQAGVRESCS